VARAKDIIALLNDRITVVFDKRAERAWRNGIAFIAEQ
jgi:hypothetical protein